MHCTGVQSSEQQMAKHTDDNSPFQTKPCNYTDSFSPGETFSNLVV